MDIQNMTIGQAQEEMRKLEELKSIFNIQSDSESKESKQDGHAYEIGKSYLVRTVTMTQVGRLKAVYKNEIVLEDASWVADTGRFSSALKNGIESESSSEIEPFVGVAIVGRGAIVDCLEYNHDLPKIQK